MNRLLNIRMAQILNELYALREEVASLRDRVEDLERPEIYLDNTNALKTKRRKHGESKK